MKKYNTKQKNLIIEFLKKNNKECLTVDDIKKHFDKNNENIGQTTIYRYLKELENENKVIKYQNITNSSYQYVNDECNIHFHLKCIKCGSLIHLDCDHLKNIENHIINEHKFKIDNTKSIIYGTCPKCMKEV